MCLVLQYTTCGISGLAEEPSYGKKCVYQARLFNLNGNEAVLTWIKVASVPYRKVGGV
jgi:hypothetical protein